MTRSNGFTLIELLVVLTIIGLIVAIAAPQLGRAPSAAAGDQRLAAVAARVAEAQGQAILSGHPVTITGATLADIGAGLAFAAADGASTELQLYPDGSATPGHLVKDGHVVARLRWTDGSLARAD